MLLTLHVIFPKVSSGCKYTILLNLNCCRWSSEIFEKLYNFCVIVIFYILTLQWVSDPYIWQPKNNQKINAEVAQFWMENLQFSCAAFACSSLILNGMICYCSMWQKHKRQSTWRIGCGPGFLHQQINLVSWTAVRFLNQQEKAGRKTTEVINSERTTST